MKFLKGKRILFLVTEDWWFWMHRLALAKSIHRAGAEVLVATPKGEFQRRIEAEGFVFQPIRLRRESFNLFSEVCSIIDLWRIYRKWRPHLVHQLALKPILYGSVAARLTAVPAVLNAITGLGYVFTDQPGRSAVLRRLVEFAYRFCLRGRNTKCLFENPDDRRQFIDRRLVHSDTTCLVTGTGVDTTLFSPRPEPTGQAVILLAARMLWDKGVGVMVEAAKILKERRVECQVVLSGVPDKANPSAIPESQLQSWHDSGIVKWIGFQAKMPDVIAQSHIACLPSCYREGIPVSLIEAAACGRPLVSTFMPGCREIVRNEWNGLLVPANDAPALAGALERLVCDPELRHTMGKRSRELVLAEFSNDVVHQHILTLYGELLCPRSAESSMHPDRVLVRRDR